MHERVYVVSVIVADDVPRVHPVRRLEVDRARSWRPPGRAALRVHGADVGRRRPGHATSACSPTSTDYFLGRESVRSTDRPGMARWREVLFALMSRNATDVATYFHLPAERVIEIGVRVEI